MSINLLSLSKPDQQKFAVQHNGETFMLKKITSLLFCLSKKLKKSLKNSTERKLYIKQCFL